MATASSTPATRCKRAAVPVSDGCDQLSLRCERRWLHQQRRHDNRAGALRHRAALAVVAAVSAAIRNSRSLESPCRRHRVGRGFAACLYNHRITRDRSEQTRPGTANPLPARPIHASLDFGAHIPTLRNSFHRSAAGDQKKPAARSVPLRPLARPRPGNVRSRSGTARP